MPAQNIFYRSRFRSEETRFWDLVNIKSELECWLWQGYIKKDSGYGQFATDNKETVRAHRYAYANKIGPSDLYLFCTSAILGHVSTRHICF